MSLRELNQMEMAFLFHIQFDLDVTPAVFDQYLAQLTSHTQENTCTLHTKWAFRSHFQMLSSTVGSTANSTDLESVHSVSDNESSTDSHHDSTVNSWVDSVISQEPIFSPFTRAAAHPTKEALVSSHHTHHHHHYHSPATVSVSPPDITPYITILEPVKCHHTAPTTDIPPKPILTLPYHKQHVFRKETVTPTNADQPGRNEKKLEVAAQTVSRKRKKSSCGEFDSDSEDSYRHHSDDRHTKLFQTVRRLSLDQILDHDTLDSMDSSIPGFSVISPEIAACV